MKAAVLKEKGSIDNIEIMDVPKPVIKSTEVLVKIYAGSINPVDYKIAEHGYFGTPMIMGSDISGIIEEAGGNVKKFKVGDEIIGSLEWQKQCAFAEYVATEEKYIALKPKNISTADAAAIPMAGLTAWQALYNHLHLQKGEKIIIHAAAGGVGLFALQFAKASGAYAIATASQKNIDFLKSFGADEVVDYNRYKLNEVVKDADAVLDTISSFETQLASLRALKKGGRYVSIVSLNIPLDENLFNQYGIKGSKFLFQSNPRQLKQIIDLIEKDKVKVIIDKRFELSQIKEALTYMKAGRSRGKNILII
ncbi:MAG: NADP-dependent oxidoreductase [Sphingobacteriales bacterium]